MRELIKLGVIVGLVFLILTGCDKEVTGDEKTAEQYVEDHGYKIISHKSETDKYKLEKSKLYGSTEAIPYQQSWGVQNVEPDNYFGKEITIYGFTVSNHPLEKIYKAKTNVYIMLTEGKVIGGYSFPNNEGLILMGSVYSLDGKTLEEVTGITFKEWSDGWKKKYGS
ncbi:hypothetical protein [Paenibacillus sp. KN14-4R]|uniref:hypothetical protein n=1 Tax=Paenibacillus sp. KN14-4R TaxID=3445773 RepID=UPI003FA0FBA6